MFSTSPLSSVIKHFFFSTNNQTAISPHLINMESSSFVSHVVSAVKGGTIEQVRHGLSAIMFGGHAEASSLGFNRYIAAEQRGTPNQYELASAVSLTSQLQSPPMFPFAWGADGSLGSPWVGQTWKFMRVHYEIPLFLALFYVLALFGLRRYMRYRPPAPWLNNNCLAVWNLSLSIFSLFAFAGECFAMYDDLMIRKSPWMSTSCTNDRKGNAPFGFMFILSKIPELLDTFFLVFKKKPVIFLHWYHHIVTLWYCWDGWVVFSPTNYVCYMNLFIHSIMYFYYFASTKPFGYEVKISGIVPLTITTLQIAQMIAGIGVIAHALKECPSTYLASDFRVMLNLWLGLAMYISFAILFSQFFISRYLKQSSLKSKVD